ncbi:MAG: hypothetical protein R3B93_14775 [Bacteroidia bacterium]
MMQPLAQLMTYFYEGLSENLPKDIVSTSQTSVAGRGKYASVLLGSTDCSRGYANSIRESFLAVLGHGRVGDLLLIGIFFYRRRSLRR